VVNRKIKKRYFGFTLVEILIVFAIIGLLSIFSAIYGPAQLQKARDAVRKQQIDRIKGAIEEYYQDEDCYPQTIPNCKNSISNGNLVLLDRIPCDPLNKLSYTYVPEIAVCPKSYQLYANLEYLQDKIIDKIGCRNGCGPECQFNYGTASSNEKLNPFCEGEPTENQLQFVCSPSGSCEIYQSPEESGCPDIYLNDPACQNKCSDPKNRCHDARGKS